MFRVPEHVDARSVDDEVIIFDARSGGYLGLNATGAAVWDVLSNGGPIAHAVDALVARFDVDPAAAEHDVALLVHQLHDLDLITTVTT